VFGFPSITRFSWKTTSSLLDDYGIPVTWPYDSDDSGNYKLKKRKTDTSNIERSKFFVERNLNFVKTFD